MIDPIQTPPAIAAPDASSGGKDAERAKVAELAQQFEAMLMTQMLRSMRQSMLSDEEDNGFGKSTMTDAFDAELGQTLTRAGGIGLSNVLIRAFDRQMGQSGPAAPLSGSPAIVQSPVQPLPPPMQPLPPVSDTQRQQVQPVSDTGKKVSDADGSRGTDSTPVLPDGQVTSAFGWRSDPFNGKARFHSGTDVRMAYGQGVKSAAGGRITFVGEQSGYGLTVKVDHGNGVESRYAHLSSAAVRPGEVVESGQVIARSGNSGRSTGPHLHFEVLENGKAVDPDTLVEHLH